MSKNRNQVPKASQPGANKPLSFIDRLKRVETALGRMEQFAVAVSESFNKEQDHTDKMRTNIGHLWGLVGEQEVRNFVVYEALKATTERLNLITVLALKIAGKEKMTAEDEANLFELLTQQTGAETSARLLDVNEYVNLRLQDYYNVGAVCAFLQWTNKPLEAPAAPVAEAVGETPRVTISAVATPQQRPQTTARFSATRGIYKPEVPHEGRETGKENTVGG